MMASPKATLLLLLSMTAGLGQSATVTQADEDRAIDSIMTEFLVQRQGPGRVMNPIAKVVRFIFHDCATGCNGCVDVDNVENRGLESTFTALNNIYDDETSGFSNTSMSRADFYAIAGIVGMRAGALNQQCSNIGLPENCTLPTPNVVIRYGRKDCSTSPNSDNDFGFPNAHGDLEHVMEVFQDGMGMTERQVVAIIGAHALGQAAPQNSGFQGPWAPPVDRLDNGFYRQLRGRNNGWHQSQLNFPDAPPGVNPRFQWDTGNVQRTPPMPGMPPMPPPPGSRMMLNTDMVLFKQVTPDEMGRETNDSCRNLFLDCDESRTASIVNEYAQNNTRWHEDFGIAFQILIEHGYPSGHLVEAGEELPALIDPVVSSPTPTTSVTPASASNLKATAIALLLAAFVCMALS